MGERKEMSDGRAASCGECASRAEWRRARSQGRDQRLRLGSLGLDAIPKTQNDLSVASTLCWALVPEGCAWSGGQGKYLVEVVLSDIQRLAVERRRVDRKRSCRER